MRLVRRWRYGVRLESGKFSGEPHASRNAALRFWLESAIF